MVKLTLAELERQYGTIAIKATDLTPVAHVGAIMYQGEIKDRFNKAAGPDGVPWLPLRFPRPQGGSKPLNNTGLLRESYHPVYDGRSFGVGTNAKQAKVMNFGGIIRPVSARALTIPLTKEAIYAGRARNMVGLFILKRVRQSFLAAHDGKKGIILHWLLADMVRIPARLQIGFTPEFIARYSAILVNYLRTGRL